MRMVSCIMALMTLVCVMSCKPGVPSGIMDEDTMENVLFDYHLAQAVAEAMPDSMEIRRYYFVHSVFDKYGITEADFDSSMVWYSRHADLLLAMYQRLEERYQEEHDKRKTSEGSGVQMYANLSAHGDTANIWGNRMFYILRSNRLDNKLNFVMEADTSFRKGDCFLWKFDTKFVFKDGTREAFCGLMIHYTDSTTVSSYRRVATNGGIEIRLNGNRKKEIRELAGFIYLPSARPDDYRMLALSNMMLIRFHKEPAEPSRQTTAADSLAKDTVIRDSVLTDTLVTDSARRVQRLTPKELRESQPVEKKINVVKEKAYQPAPKKTQKRKGRKG